MVLFQKRCSGFALLNLLIVAVIGVILRYKIAFSLPFIDQRNLLHGHSHFAFAGWITHTLMFLLVLYLAAKKGDEIIKKFQWLINANLFTAYGMLIFFPIQGYAFFSILFSTLSIFVSYVFAYLYWKELNSLPQQKVSHWWIKAALLFNALSSLGAFSLALMMATKNMHENIYLASVYFFLHFQYNGWFLFACIGLATEKFFCNVRESVLKKIFLMFVMACVPAYLLSALWLPIPLWIYVIVVLAAFSQLAGWIFILKLIRQQLFYIKSILNTTSRRLFLLSSIAFSIKLLLQLGSTIPSLSKLAFGFRPIVIGYLHLILLGVITLFLIGFMVTEKIIILKKSTIYGIVIFTAGVIVNELFLMIQGFAALNYITVPLINELLFFASIVICSGIILVNYGHRKRVL